MAFLNERAISPLRHHSVSPPNGYDLPRTHGSGGSTWTHRPFAIGGYHQAVPDGWSPRYQGHHSVSPPGAGLHEYDLPGGRGNAGAGSSWTHRPFETSRYQASPDDVSPRYQRSSEVVLAAVHRHWSDPNGLPNVVQDIQNDLQLDSTEDALTLIERQLGKRLPADLVQQCLERRQAPCTYGLRCPYTTERAHIDRFSHPCLQFFEDGTCSQTKNRVHMRYFSHVERSADEEEDGDDVEARVNSQTRASTSPRKGRVETEVSDETAFGRYYYDCLRSRDIKLLAALYAPDAVVDLRNEQDGHMQEFQDASIEDYLTWILDKYAERRLQVTLSVPKPKTVKANWKCAATGLRMVRDDFLLVDNAPDANGGKPRTKYLIAKHRSVVHHSKAERSPRDRSRTPRQRGPPEPFSDDPRLWGKPLTPSAEDERQRLRDRMAAAGKQRHADDGARGNICSRSPCPRPASPRRLRNAPTTSPPRGRGSPAGERLMDNAAATKIQAAFRGRRARAQAGIGSSPSPRHEREHDEEEPASHDPTAAQHELRVETQRMDPSGASLDATLTDQPEESMPYEKAATKLQAGIRGFLSRRKYAAGK
ncbi:hypothetical protein DIPPA_08827 [Diplonema papillatum]|nr:hypothetical protein DIPPA_08827 [Diplonema papillatum]